MVIEYDFPEGYAEQVLQEEQESLQDQEVVYPDSYIAYIHGVFVGGSDFCRDTGNDSDD